MQSVGTLQSPCLTGGDHALGTGLRTGKHVVIVIVWSQSRFSATPADPGAIRGPVRRGPDSRRGPVEPPATARRSSVRYLLGSGKRGTHQLQPRQKGDQRANRQKVRQAQPQGGQVAGKPGRTEGSASLHPLGRTHDPPIPAGEGRGGCGTASPGLPAPCQPPRPVLCAHRQQSSGRPRPTLTPHRNREPLPPAPAVLALRGDPTWNLPESGAC